MSRPPIDPDKTLAGISLDPQTLERVVPESRRADGTVRKQLKIRPGFTPQEDVRRFRSTRQQQTDSNALPKGHIIGWVPSSSATPANTTDKPLSKSAKKNAKRKEKRAEKKQGDDAVPESWDDDDEEVQPGATAPVEAKPAPETNADQKGADGLAEELDKLKLQGT
ncbi:hypothetical protein M378DRAFT_67985 [Amanita muscaria Koide BX008]|uniref:WIBG Mago-binding domain-containing protein n=1 Tax=Amanita muscaria (strain Koide BX008) TaxID=946122 RepID=A0A0C2XLY5_AMAMK|nr:hypothetical protein M378DRAFT_67985 [Amanita muscaria Koide BX008]